MPQTGAAVSRDRSTDRREPPGVDAAGRTRAGVPGAATPGTGVAGRRTVAIRGRGSERYVSRRARAARRPPQRRYERAGFRPDRAALWAVMLGVLLILVAAASAHAATVSALSGLH